MGDLMRTRTHLVPMTKEMQEKHTQIRINEKTSQIKGLQQRLDDLKKIDQQKLELQIDTLEEEIDFLKKKKVVDLKEDVKDKLKGEEE